MKKTPLLDGIDWPADLRRCKASDLGPIALELRQFLIDTVASTGGHLAANLGTVELTLALHYVFDTPRDRIVWDVGHQAYAHKILSGRRAAMATLRQHGASPASPNATRANTTPSAPGTPAPRSAPLQAWPLPRPSRAGTTATWP